MPIGALAQFDNLIHCGKDRDGKLHGRYIEKDLEGNKLVKGKMKHGIRIGTWKFLDEKKRIGMKIKYNRKGKEVYTQHNLLPW